MRLSSTRSAARDQPLFPEKTGRRARLIEFDPSYCDLIVRRFEQVTGKQALLETSSKPFEVVAEERTSNVWTGQL